MKTDSLFYKMFLDFPEIFFELIDQPEASSLNYRFTSQEVKQLSFRLDGLFLPLQDSPTSPFYLVEVQFQPREELYYRLFSELFLYLKQYQPLSPWQVVVIYPNRQVERIPFHQFEEMLSLWRVQRIYLDELEETEPTSLGIGVLKLVIQNESQAVNSAKILIERISTEIAEPQTQRNIINLIESIIIYKLPLKNREEIEAMFELQDLKKTRFYQEALGEGKAEGRQEGEANLVIRQLNRRFEEIPQNLREKILAMSVEQLENLGESLLDFESLSDLVNWLDR
jgi:predicted transposase/invertase (TIGR01784 family)